ncbi:MAG: thioredoxin family protein [Alphaproteobacteria bacterium]|nr:thioredoxin family protein [Alphaproteobacteria bacterium]
MKRILSFFILFFLLVLPCAGVQALSSRTFHDDALSVRLVTAQDTLRLGDTQPVWLGLEVFLSEGWHTYWRAPGDAGKGPVISWEGSRNIGHLALDYPMPKRTQAYGMESFGYHDRVLFPIKMTRAHKNKDVALNLKAEILLCNEICIPKTYNFSLVLPLGSGEKSAEAEMIEQALAKIPLTENREELALLKAERLDRSLRILVQAQSMQDIDLFIETPSKEVLFTKPETEVTGFGTAILTTKIKRLPEDVRFEKLPLTLTLTQGDHALTRTIAAQDGLKDNFIIRFLLLALVGGFILNLMPCVLPVLSLKILSVVKHGGTEKKIIRRAFLTTAAGIVTSFLLLATVTFGLKVAGHELGWGMQFQQPLFLVFMTLLLTLFAANLWGFFQINLPQSFLNKLGNTQNPILAGDFSAGMLATLMATPCSAPFLGTAVGFALAANAFEIYAIFTALGIGMAIPYFLIALFPQISASLPKPGAWMMPLTRLLGLGLAGTALWLLFVLNTQIGAMLTCAWALALAALVLQLYMRHTQKRSLIKPLIFLLLGSVLIFGMIGMTRPIYKDHQQSAWIPFNEAQLMRYVKEGKTVFVDITADWCLTCKANKQLMAFSDELVEKLAPQNGIILMQGDLTNPNDAITDFLKKNGRFGIPFNMVYGPHAPEGILLAELVTPQAVLDALEKAQNDTPP